MSNTGDDRFIGVFDSGAGGVSVLRACVALLPHEHFRYFGDSANAPYGDQGEQRIRELSFLHAARMIDEGAKAIVIACNTATSAAAAALRETYPDLPILGIEPALKPASKAGGRILVLATKATVQLDKYNVLAQEHGAAGNVVTVPCSGLVELIESGDLGDPAISEYLQRKLGGYVGKVDSVVLGCTHYPFLKRQITAVLGDVAFFDGAEGTARNLKRHLEQNGLCACTSQQGGVEFESSVPAQVALYKRLFEQAP
ncbi:MAG: glutamate racemase [Eggerthellaceae bacterium]|nr:glutamate racemase [Eggerthellaceae bacterium]